MNGITRAFSLVFLLAAVAPVASAQQSVYMFVDSIKGAEPAPHSDEFKLEQFSFGSKMSPGNPTRTGGLSAGKAAYSPLKITMRLVPSATATFFRWSNLGSRIPSIEIRVYATSGKISHRTVFENAMLTSVSTEGADESIQTIEFAYSRVKWFAPADGAGGEPRLAGCWDINENAKC